MTSGKTDSPEGALFKQAQSLMTQGRPDQAVSLLQNAAASNPGSAPLFQQLGVALARSGNRAQAIKAFERALTLDPDSIRACFGLSTALFEEGRFREAEDYCRAGLGKDEDCIPFYPLLGKILLRRGQLEDAAGVLQKAISKQPEDPVLQSNLAYILMELGRKDEAAKALEQAIAQNPLNADYYQSMSLCRPCKDLNDPQIARLEELLKNPNLDKRGKSTLHFTLAEIFARFEEFERAFDHYKQANELARANVSYHHEETLNVFTQIKKAFTAEFLVRHKNSGLDDRRMIFVIGMPRSGTSLTEQILASHSGVFGAGELKILSQLQNDFLGLGKNGNYVADVQALSAEDIQKSVAFYLEKICDLAPEAQRIVDKMPQNFIFAGLIHLMFPNAKIIHCLRSKKDVLFSNYKSDFKENLPFSFRFEDINAYYDAYEDLMAHWHSVMPGFIFDFSYEELVQDQEKQTRALLDYCGLDWEDRCLRFHEKRRHVGTASTAQVQKPLYQSGIDGWKKYADVLPTDYFQD